MNTNTAAHKAKIRHLCSCLVLCLHLASGAIPGPCEHSVTEEHLQTLQKLILNQVQNGCSINYWFTERQDLSEVCYIKAAFPFILDLLNTHFTYEKGSDNYRYTSSLKDLIYNIYSEECINEAIEENTLTFARLHTSLPKESLQKTKEVFQMYKRLMSSNDKPVSWNCEDEYANDFPETTTEIHTQTTGTPECQCSCPHNQIAFVVNRSTATASPVSPYTLSGAHIVKNKNDRSKASEPAVQDEAPNSTPNQISAISPGPELYPQTELFTEEQSEPIHADSTDFITSIAPSLLDYSTDSSVVIGSEPHSFSPIASSSELASIPTRTLLPSVTPQSYKKINTHLISNRNPALALAKRSLDTRKQGMLTDSFSKLLQRWISETRGMSKNEKVKLSREPDCKDSRCGKGTDQRSRDRVKRHSEEEEYQLIHKSMYTTFLMTSACSLLLLVTVLCYCKQQRIKARQQDSRTIHF